jgi:hypothetical protein
VLLYQQPNPGPEQDHDRCNPLPFPSHDAANYHQKQGHEIKLNGGRRLPEFRQTIIHGVRRNKPGYEREIQQAQRARNPTACIDAIVSGHFAPAFLLVTFAAHFLLVEWSAPPTSPHPA